MNLTIPTLIKHVVNYARDRAKEYEKQIDFNMTTNGLLLTDDVIEYLNTERIKVMISLDGPKETQDVMRPCAVSGMSSYDCIVPKAKAFIKSRNGKVSVRATVTRYNLNLLGITQHLVEMGFGNVYLAPVSISGETDYSLRKDNFDKLAHG